MKKRDAELLKKILYPPMALVVFLAVGSAAAITAAFVLEKQESFWAGIVYGAAFYTLVVLSIRLTRVGKIGKQRLQENAFYHRYKTDLSFKTRVSAAFSLAVTLCYCAVKAGAGIYYRSPWLGAIAFYYVLLGIARCLLLLSARKRGITRKQAYRRYTICGYLLLALTIALAVINMHVLYRGGKVVYPGFLIYGAAAFTFYSLTVAIAGVIRHRKGENPIYSAGRALSLATALVSLLFLQTALLTAFGDGGTWQHAMNMATASGVFWLVACMAVWMIKTGGRALKTE